jgi:hypothetical protein
MSARILILTLCGLVAIGGVSAAIADDSDDETATLNPVELRKDDSAPDTELVDDDEGDDPTGDRDKTRGDDGTNWGHNNDHDSTAGHDGTSGGNNSEVAPAVAPAPAAAPAPAPVYGDYSDDAGVVYGDT